MSSENATPRTTTKPTRYGVSCIPEDNVNHSSFVITVEYRGEDCWAVLQRGHWCLGVDGEWDYEPRPSSREDDWLATHRFDLPTALRLAEEHAPKVTVNGYTVADVLSQHEQGRGHRRAE